jgi:hypothetical protein
VTVLFMKIAVIDSKNLITSINVLCMNNMDFLKVKGKDSLCVLVKACW